MGYTACPLDHEIAHGSKSHLHFFLLACLLIHIDSIIPTHTPTSPSFFSSSYLLVSATSAHCDASACGRRISASSVCLLQRESENETYCIYPGPRMIHGRDFVLHRSGVSMMYLVYRHPHVSLLLSARASIADPQVLVASTYSHAFFKSPISCAFAFASMIPILPRRL